MLAICLSLAAGQFSFAAGLFRIGKTRSPLGSFFGAATRFFPNVSCDGFGEVKNLYIVAFRVVRGVSKHDRTIRAGNNHR